MPKAQKINYQAPNSLTRQTIDSYSSRTNLLNGKSKENGSSSVVLYPVVEATISKIPPPPKLLSPVIEKKPPSPEKLRPPSDEVQKKQKKTKRISRPKESSDDNELKPQLTPVVVLPPPPAPDVVEEHINFGNYFPVDKLIVKNGKLVM